MEHILNIADENFGIPHWMQFHEMFDGWFRFGLWCFTPLSTIFPYSTIQNRHI
jgi:hypothetical protein